MAGKIYLFGSSMTVAAALAITLLLKITMVTGTSVCSSYDFPCENGECVDSELWCDGFEDCPDGTDEKYCKKSAWNNINPNKCPFIYFRCRNGPCIPLIGRCDGFDNCDDKSDEKNCVTTTHPVTISHTTTLPPIIESEGFNTTRLFASLNVSESSLQMEPFSGLSSSAFSKNRSMARNWLLSQRKDNYGWGEETPRAIVALYLSEEQPLVKYTDKDLLMIKQLEMQLSLELARNGTKPMKRADLALFINSLLVSCKNPKNFYGDNLIRILRDDVNAAQIEESFINPSIYLTLCFNNASTYDDTNKLQNIFLTQNTPNIRIDMQALAMLTTACIYKRTNFLNASTYERLKMEFLRNLKVHGFPGNVYKAALVFQALHELKVTLPGLLQSILQRQQENGSFGGILATYLVLPVLAGRSFLQINDHCSQRYSTELAPLAVLQNLKRRKIYVRFALKDGNPPEITQTIEMQVAEGINFLDVMRLAQEINPKYSFKLDGNRDVPVVYSIGGIPNDAEKGLFWTLYLTTNNRVGSDIGNLRPYPGNIKQLIPHPGDEYVFWLKSI